MRQAFRKISPVLELARVTSALGAVANACFVVLWTHANPQEPGTAALNTLPLAISLACASLLALGLFVFAVAMNDVLDVRRDRAFNPDRPLAAGRLTVEAAFATVIGALLVALAGATPLGTTSVAMTLAIAAAITVYNTIARAIPGAALVLLALIFTAYPLAINPSLHFLWPLWVGTTHIMLAAVFAHTIGHKVPRLSRRAAIFVALAWAAATVVLTLGTVQRSQTIWPVWVSPWTAFGVGVLALMFLELLRRRANSSSDPARIAERVWRYATLWPGLYACAWLMGTGSSNHAIAMGIITTVSFAAMITLRELYAAMDSPLEFRR